MIFSGARIWLRTFPTTGRQTEGRSDGEIATAPVRGALLGAEEVTHSVSNCSWAVGAAGGGTSRPLNTFMPLMSRKMQKARMTKLIRMVMKLP